MKISIEEIKKAPENRLEIKFSDYIEGLDLKDKAIATLIASTSDFGVTIRGNIKANLILQCDRCLSDYVYNLDTDINEDFVTENRAPADQKEYELGENDFVEELNGKKEIDITDLIYQSIILELPYKKLCSDNCPGLEEFQELNNKNEKYIDERLEVFKTFSENGFNDKNELVIKKKV